MAGIEKNYSHCLEVVDLETKKNLPHQVIGFHLAWKLDYLRVTIAQPVKCAVSRGLSS
ncbi:TPA: hypothetical protein ACGO9X_001577 [Streptococcus suis]